MDGVACLDIGTFSLSSIDGYIFRIVVTILSCPNISLYQVEKIRSITHHLFLTAMW